MSTIELAEANKELLAAIECMNVDNLLQAYGELFPDDPLPMPDEVTNASSYLRKIVERFEQGLEPEAAVDLWNVAFPHDRRVYFNEADDLLHFTRD
jgi:hypothetical protein